MKKSFLTVFLLFLCLGVHSQIKYEEGYIINNTGNRTEVLILNRDWRDNPSEITYKVGEEGRTQTAGIEEIREFGIEDHARYERHLAAIDKSSEQLKKMTSIAEPDYHYQRVFLQKLVDGKSDLFSYREGVLERFFYLPENGDLEPLIYKKYKKDNKIAVNNSFRQQLYSNLNCKSLPAGAFRDIDYSRNDLIDYFVDYNACENYEYQVLIDKSQKGKFNLYAKGGIQFSSIKIERGLNAKGAEFDFDPGIKLGLEAEFVLPFNRNKWAIYIEPTYQDHVIEDKLVNHTPYDFYDGYLTMDLKFISTLVGARHYFFLNESSKIFFNAGVAYDIPISTQILIDRGDSYELQPELEEIKTGAHFIAGLGFNYSDRITAEVRYYSPKFIRGARTIPTHYMLDWDSTINTVAVMVGYRFW